MKSGIAHNRYSQINTKKFLPLHFNQNSEKSEKQVSLVTASSVSPYREHNMSLKVIEVA